MSKRPRTSSEGDASSNSAAASTSSNLNMGAMDGISTWTAEEKLELLARLQADVGATSMTTGARSRSCERATRPIALLRR
jgi:hypothetical protein